MPDWLNRFWEMKSLDMTAAYHQPVMVREVLDGLITSNDGTYLDATFGGGGHSRSILERLTVQGRLVAFDQDAEALEQAPDDSRLMLIQGNFRHMAHYLRYERINQVDGILADLGVSSHQIDRPDRGFSHSISDELDMRMNDRAAVSAIDVLNTEREEDLLYIFSTYGQVRNSRTLAKTIVAARAARPFSNAISFLEVIESCIMGNRVRYLSQVFQAIRIKVNDEVGALQDFLAAAIRLIRPGGRLVVLTYHSLEDRMVKHFIKSGQLQPDAEPVPAAQRPFEPLYKKPLEPSAAEVLSNRRARSARLRIGIKMGTS